MIRMDLLYYMEELDVLRKVGFTSTEICRLFQARRRASKGVLLCFSVY